MEDLVLELLGAQSAAAVAVDLLDAVARELHRRVLGPAVDRLLDARDERVDRAAVEGDAHPQVLVHAAAGRLAPRAHEDRVAGAGIHGGVDHRRDVGRDVRLLGGQLPGRAVVVDHDRRAERRHERAMHLGPRLRRRQAAHVDTGDPHALGDVVLGPRVEDADSGDHADGNGQESSDSYERTRAHDDVIPTRGYVHRRRGRKSCNSAVRRSSAAGRGSPRSPPKRSFAPDGSFRAPSAPPARPTRARE